MWMTVIAQGPGRGGEVRLCFPRGSAVGSNAPVKYKIGSISPKKPAFKWRHQPVLVTLGSPSPSFLPPYSRKSPHLPQHSPPFQIKAVEGGQKCFMS